MEDTEQRWSVEQVLALAPDAASQKAGTRLAAPGPWTGTGTSGPSGDGGGAVVWGLCAGSGSKPYRTAVDLAGPAFNCSCPSRKFPCKHALALLLLWARGEVPTATDEGTPPQWVAQWHAKRTAAAREKTARGASAAADPAAARKRAERRAQRVAAGATELEARLADQLRSGLAMGREEQRGWEGVAARMVDAQAPGLAARVRDLAAIPASGGDWPSRLLEEYAMLHLLARGCLNLDSLPGPLADTVRSRLGFTTASAELLAGPTLRDSWLVLAQQDSVEGTMTTRRIWLLGARSRRAALLLSFGAAGRAPEVTLPVGRSLEAELAYHPGGLPLRAALGTRYGPPTAGQTPPGVPVQEALTGYGVALGADPWLDEWPVVLAGVVPIPDQCGWQLADAEGDSALPVDPRRLGRPGLWRLAAVSGGRPVTVFGTVGHRGFTPLTTWSAARPVAL
ncbi:SWIM zinc finger family protein [Streptantibioticus rubrisoli]|uniref:SWIM zinc finger family protein n=1 Tax=Streptantibioticus rubrisoli TaxID=1387313 RepID=A0ABT1PJJ9_9ACTN|nr:SWIM zinc finger family protein [Streptantibioticus rubrisoli]MCQ4045542.1 SWIM zinc finger family protein [Streptantibioticus rubrisoli]